MNNETQNIQPDYSFILNQQSPEPPKKGLDKRVLIIFGGLMVLVLFGGLSLFMSVTGSVKTNSTDTTKPETAVNSFLEAVRAKDYQQAAKQLDPLESNTSTLATELEKGFQVIDATSCQVNTLPSSRVVGRAESVCVTSNKNFRVKTDYQTTLKDGKQVIIEYTVKYEKNT